MDRNRPFDRPKVDAADVGAPAGERQPVFAEQTERGSGVEGRPDVVGGDATSHRESLEALRERDREHVERGLEGVKEKLDAIEAEEVRGGEAPEQPQQRNVSDPAITERSVTPSVGERLGDITKRIWYPSSDRLVRVALPTIAASGLTIGAGVIGVSALGLLGASVSIVGGMAFVGGEVMKRFHQRNVGSVMSVTKVYERLSPDVGALRMVGELHLVGSEGLARVRAAPREQKGRVFLSEVQRSLQTLEEHVRAGSSSVADLEGFFGETDVFARRDLERMGLPFTEVPIPPWRRPLLWGSDKIAKVISGRWRELGKSRRPKPVHRIHFTRDQFLEAMERSRERNEGAG